MIETLFRLLRYNKDSIKKYSHLMDLFFIIFRIQSEALWKTNKNQD